MCLIRYWSALLYPINLGESLPWPNYLLIHYEARWCDAFRGDSLVSVGQVGPLAYLTNKLYLVPPPNRPIALQSLSPHKRFHPCTFHWGIHLGIGNLVLQNLLNTIYYHVAYNNIISHLTCSYTYYLFNLHNQILNI